MPAIWLNGQLVRAEEARISVLDRGVIWGYGLFETLRAYSGRLWAFDEHFARLEAGAEVLGIPLRPAGEIRDATDEVLRAGGLEDAGVRVTVTGGAGPPDPHAEPTAPPSTVVTAWALPDYTALYADGVSLVVLSGGGRALADVKATSYAASVAGRLAASRAGAEDGLFVGASGEILEATGANLIAARGSSLITPPVSEGLLPGVTRVKVLELAPQLGFHVEERRILLDELFGADEVVLTSSLREVYPVREIDGRLLARQDAAARLRGALEARVAAELELS